MVARRDPDRISSRLFRLCVLGVAITILLFLLGIRYHVTFAPFERHRLELDAGRIEYRYNTPAPTPAPPRPPMFRFLRNRRAPSVEWLIFDWHLYPNWWFFRFPLWLPLLVFAAPAGVVLVRRLRSHGPGRCVKCGYILKGHHERGHRIVTCPECGWAGESAPGSAKGQ